MKDGVHCPELWLCSGGNYNLATRDNGDQGKRAAENGCDARGNSGRAIGN